MSSNHNTGIATEQPSHKAIDNGNPAIFKPKFFVLDDISIDLITVVVSTITVAAVFTSYIAGIPAILGAAAILLPLRTFFPRPVAPEGLVLITGGSSGIGAELAYIFASRGHDLILVGRNEDQLRKVKENVAKISDQTVNLMALDLSMPGSAKHLYDTVIKEGLSVSVLVNNAGLGAAGEVLEQSIDIAERMTILNCVTVVQLTQLFGRDMAKCGKGWILQVASVGGEFPFLLIKP